MGNIGFAREFAIFKSGNGKVLHRFFGNAHNICIGKIEGFSERKVAQRFFTVRGDGIIGQRP